MKKIVKLSDICFLSVLFFSLMGFSCKSASKDDTRTQVLYEIEGENGENIVEDLAPPPVEMAPPVEEAPLVEETPIVEDQASEEGEIKDETEDTIENKIYLGWKETSNKPIDFTQGKIRFKVKPRTGTFNILVLNEDERSIPLLSTANEYMTSSFYLQAGKKIYKLNENSYVKTFARKIENGVSIRYFIKNVANVVVDFVCIKSTEESDFDTIKVTSTVTNLKKSKTKFSLKLILDTLLGETDRHHFYDSKNNPVRNELSLRNFDEDKWFLSKNSSGSLQVIFDGIEDITKPSLLALANYSTLVNNKSWEPDMMTYKTFDTVLSYNNSALGLYWENENLDTEENYTRVFYMSVASDGNLPCGDLLITVNEDSPIVESSENVNPTEKNTNREDAVQDFVTQSPEVIESPSEDLQKPLTNAGGKDNVLENPSQVDVIEEKPEEIKTTEEDLFRDKYTEEYVRRLLIRIAELETSGEEINKSELDRLNEELDSILEYLRK